MKDNEVRVGKVIDEKLYALRLELAKEKKVREESHEQYLEVYGRQINQINEAIDEENKEREESSLLLMSILNEEVKRFELRLDQEAKERDLA